MFYQVIKVRFDVSNPDVIGILVQAGENGYSYFKIYRYKINENNNSLIYEKTIFEQVAQINDNSSKLIYEDSETFPTYKTIWQYTVEWSSYINFKVVDFFMNGEDVKPFYGVNTDINEYLRFTEYYCYDNYSICHDIYRMTLGYGFGDITTKIFYGNDNLASSNNVCSGGGLQENGDYRGCTEEYEIQKHYYPLAIFNKNDFAYRTSDGKLVSTLPFDLSKYVINVSTLSTNQGSGKERFNSLNSLLLNGNSYSFNLFQNLTSSSFSLSLGILECGGMLVTDHQMDGGYVAIRGSEFVVIKSCNDFKKINAPSYSINEQEVYDFSVK